VRYRAVYACKYQKAHKEGPCDWLVGCRARCSQAVVVQTPCLSAGMAGVITTECGSGYTHRARCDIRCKEVEHQSAVLPYSLDDAVVLL